MTATARAVEELKIAWNRGATGWFTLGTSTLSGPDRLAPQSQVIPAFSGTYDEVSPYFHEATWSRGRSTTFDQVEQGKWVGSLHDPDGRFNPKNAASPLYGQTDDTGRPIRHRAKYGGVWYPQFYGFIRTTEYEVRSRGRGVLHIEADDIFGKLDQPAPTIGSLTSTSTGGVIGACLDAIGWTDVSYRDIDTGDAIAFWPGISDSSKTLLQLIGDVLATEFGLFWADGAGTTRYEDRNARLTKSILYTLANEMRALSSGSSLDRRYTRATYTKTGSTPQTHSDSALEDPIFGIGIRALPVVESPYLASDEAALARAQWAVSMRKDPVGPIWSLKLDNRKGSLLQAMLDLEISDKVTTSEAETGTTGDFFVERLECSVSRNPYRRTADYILSELEFTPFVLGTSVLNGSDVLVL